MKTIDGIIFDVDGTLWDSTDIVAKSWTDCLAQETDLNLEVTAQMLHGLFGQLLPDIAKQVFSNETRERQLELIDLCCQAEHRALQKHGAPLYPDLEKTLQILSKKYPLYLVSNCEAGYIEVFLESTGLEQYFKGHLCPGDTGNAKAANILQIVDTYQLKSPVYVGDTQGDFNACREAGVPFVFASYGFGDVKDPDYRISTPMDLTRLF